MRVLHLTRDYPPRSHGGLSSAVRGWVEAHRARGGGAAVISFDAYRPHKGATHAPREQPGEVAELRIEGHFEPTALRAFAERQRIDLLHLHDPMLHSLARELRSALGVPLLTSVHVLQRELVQLRELPELTQSAVAEASAVIEADAISTPSPSAAARLQCDYPTLRATPAVLPLCVEPAAAPPDLTRPAPPTVLFAGRFADVKGASDFLQAAEALLERLPAVRFELAGGLPASPRGERRFVRRVLDASAPARAGRLEWLGWCERPALQAAYRRAHVLVAPSWSETFGQCAFEALAQGTPLVTTRVGAYADYLEHGRECLQVAPHSPRALADAIFTLLSDETRRRALAERAPAAAAPFAPQRVGDALQAVYARTLEGS